MSQLKRLLLAVAGILGLAGCGSLPDDGPSAKAVEQHAKVESRARYALVNIDYPVTQAVAATPRSPLAGLRDANSLAPTDLICDGDLISVTVFESGSAPLFGRQLATMNGPSVASGGSSQDTFPHLVVDRSGAVTLPFAGAVQVRGLTPNEAAVTIRAALRGRAVDPQVLVSVLSSAENSVSVLGEVRNPGRFPVSASNDRLLDVIAAAGGPTKPAPDVRVFVVRGDQTVSAPLSLLMDSPAQNIRLAPHDQVRLMSRERKFSMIGAFGHVSETSIVDEHLSLAAAITRSGGLDTYSANNAAVFVFRFERPDVAAALGLSTPATSKGVPVVYRLDMRDPNAFFLAENFEVEPDDIIYVPRASSIAVKKFLDLVSVVTSVTYTAAVTGANVP